MSKDSLMKLNIYDLNREDEVRCDNARHTLGIEFAEHSDISKAGEDKPMNSADEKKRMIGRMAKEAGLIDDPKWLERLDEPVPLWIVLDILLRWMDRSETTDGPYD
jgi:hypothetical protein